MKGFVFNVSIDERATWADDLRKQITDSNTIVVAGDGDLLTIGLVETDNPEIELLIRLKFSNVVCYGL